MSIKLFSSGLAGDEPASVPGGDPLWWLHETGPLVRRFVLGEVLGPPPGLRRPERGPAPGPAARPPAATPGGKGEGEDGD